MKTIYNIGYGLLILILITSCDASSSDSLNSGEGQGGSLARFAVSGNYLYAVNYYSLKCFSLTTPEKPQLSQENEWWSSQIETIFPYNNKLFLGTRNGMDIYDISGGLPVYYSSFSHIYSCDPVVVNGDYAFLTLNSTSNWCGQNSNELQVIDIQNLKYPELIGQYTMTNPAGLGLNNEYLFVCDNGIKVYKIGLNGSLQLENHFTDIEALDVIVKNDILIVTGKQGIYQFKYQNSQLTELSKISVKS